MTPIQWVARIRQMIDDEQGLSNKAGVFWDDRDIVQQIDSSQFSCVNWAAENHLSHVIEGLVAKQDYALTSNKTIAALPTDYLYAMSGQVNSLPARLHIGSVGAVIENTDHYGVAIGGDAQQVTFIGGANTQTGTLWYYRVPTSFAVNPAANRTELWEPLYHAIMYHTAATLLLKDGMSTRLQYQFQHAMARLQGGQAMLLPYDDITTA